MLAPFGVDYQYEFELSTNEVYAMARLVYSGG